MSEKTRVSKFNASYRAMKLKTIMTEKWQVVLLVSLFWAGLIIGCLYIGNAEGTMYDRLTSVITENVVGRAAYSGVQIFKSAIFKYGLFLFASFLFGLSAVGYPGVLAIPLFSGIANGIISGFVYTSFGWKGFFYCLSTLYPGLIISMVALIIGSCESLEMSVSIFKIAMDKNRLSNENTLKKYLYQYMILFGITIAACIFEVLMCNLFLPKFSF